MKYFALLSGFYNKSPELIQNIVMAFFHVFILSAIQGATEFLPVSSSAHLLLYNELVYTIKNSISFDIAVHLGSLLAVIFILRNLIFESFVFFNNKNQSKNLIFPLIISTIPIIITALIIEAFSLIEFSRQLIIVAIANIVFAIFLYISDKTTQKKSISEITKLDALIIGIFQSFALIPGASRSGTAITGARLLRFSRKDSILISLLMSIPTIGCSALYLFFKIYNNIDGFDIKLLLAAGLFSFLLSILSLKFLLWLGQVGSFTPFVIYRIFLGTLIIMIFIR